MPPVGKSYFLLLQNIRTGPHWKSCAYLAEHGMHFLHAMSLSNSKASEKTDDAAAASKLISLKTLSAS